MSQWRWGYLLSHSLQWTGVRLGHFEGLLDPEPEESCSMFGEDMTRLRNRESLGMSH